MDSNEYHREYNLRRYYSRRSEFIEALGGRCVECGSVDDLQFDHIDRSTKDFDIGGKMLSYSYDRVRAEAMKCQLLCPSCHHRKTAYDLGKKPRECGTITMYTHGKCRCEDCKRANRDQCREYRKKKMRS